MIKQKIKQKDKCRHNYAKTRHNIGFMFIDMYAKMKNCDEYKEKFNFWPLIYAIIGIILFIMSR